MRNNLVYSHSARIDNTNLEWIGNMLNNIYYIIGNPQYKVALAPINETLHCESHY